MLARTRKVQLEAATRWICMSKRAAQPKHRKLIVSVAVASVGFAGYTIHTGDFHEETVASSAPAPIMSSTCTDSITLPPIRVAQRALWLLWSFSLVCLLSPIAWLLPEFREKVYYELIYRAICYSRSAAFVKWAQWASVRWDLFPGPLCLLLGQLQASAPPHSYAHTVNELTQAGLLECHDEGKSAIRDSPLLLRDLEERPIASGSIAQVHLASFDAERVVVKVRHPRVAEELLLDFHIMHEIAEAIHVWVPALRWLNAPDTLKQFELAMTGQCDLSREAENLDTIRNNFRRKADWVIIPKVIYATPAVLVESFEYGELMSEFINIWRGHELSEAAQAQAQFVISRGEDGYLQMLLVDNFMHADLHPGNLLFRRQAEQPTKFQIVVLDAGMVARLTEQERRNFIGLLQGIGDGNGQAVAERLLSFSDADGVRDSNAFISDVKALCREKAKGYGTGLDIGKVTQGLLQIMYQHSVSIRGNYATLIAGMLCLEGMARDLEPRYNIIDVAYPLLRAHQLLGDKLFQRVFSCAQWLLPLPMWDLIYRCGIYAALHGESLKRFMV